MIDMSHAMGAVRFSDGEVLYYEYDGTADIAYSSLGTKEEVSANWRNLENNFRRCTCGHASEPVIIASSYGGGFSWEGKACKKCKAITDEFAPFGYGDEESEDAIPKLTDGLPDWFI